MRASERESTPYVRSTITRAASFLGFVAATLTLGISAELFLRSFTPGELDLYAGERSARRGPLVADSDFGARYRSWGDLYAENAPDLAPWLEESRRPRARQGWVFIGNSFVHGAGMLVDHVRTAVPERQVVTLHRTDPLPIRLAQIDLLAARAAAPERIFIPLSTVDLLELGRQPLATLRVSRGGALTYAPRLPPEPGAWLMRHSKLVTAAWFRTGRHRGNLDFDKRKLDDGIEEPLRSDLHMLFANLARRIDSSRVRLSVILIPSYQQLVDDVGTGFQQRMHALLQPLGYDVVDPYPALHRQSDPAALFLCDKHFTSRANQLVVDSLLTQLGDLNGAAAPPGR
jgi:hypothetical protein